jgi:hypothetical protein
MSSVKKSLPKVSRHDEAMYVRFADFPYGMSLEIADNFVVDLSPAHDIIGLEILWDETDRADSEFPMLAFGILAAAMFWSRHHYNEIFRCEEVIKDSQQHIAPAVRIQTQKFIDAAGLPMRVVSERRADLNILDYDGKALLCADFRYPWRRLARRTASGDHGWTPAIVNDLIHASLYKMQTQLLPTLPGAVGLSVFIDETGELHRDVTEGLGSWIEWPEATPNNGGNVWAHIAIIPPADHEYPWLPKTFLPTRATRTA